MRSRALGALAALTLVVGCRATKAPAPGASASAAAAVSAKPPPSPSAAVAHVLAPRLDPDALSVQEARREVVGALTEAKRLAAAGREKDALARLAGARRLDPTGAVVAVELSRLAALAGEPGAAAHWAYFAALAARGHAALEKAASAALVTGTAGAARPVKTRVPSVSGPFPGIDAACAGIVAQLAVGRGSRLLELDGLDTRQARCSPEQSATHPGPTVRRVTVLRASVGGEGRLDLGWVAVTTGAGVLSYGPVAEAYTPARHRLVNDFAIDLQQTDALHGGEPEAVIRSSERWTFADVALNEVVTVDRTRVVLLTMDRGALEPGVELLLSEREERKVIDREDNKPVPGWQRSKPAVSTFDLRVEWGASNEIRLVRPEGNRQPPVEGLVRLFQ